MKYERHPLSAAWPDMADEDFVALKDSISYSGLLEPITLYEGQILDGWHRYVACVATGMEPSFIEFSGSEPVQFVQDKHTRRPLTLTQRLTCIALMHRWRPRGGNQSAGPADCLSSKDIAKAAGGGVRSAEHVKEAITKGAPELVQAMKAGKVGAEKAAAIAKLPQEQQAAAIHQPLPRPPHVSTPAAEPVAAPAALQLVEAAEPDAEPEHTELDAARNQIADLQAALALASLGDVPEADRSQAAELIEHLRAEVKGLSAQLRAVTSSRDFLMQENAQMKLQMAAQRREIERLKLLTGGGVGV